MVKNVKISSANVRWYLRTLSVAKIQNMKSAPKRFFQKRYPFEIFHRLAFFIRKN